MSTDAEHEEPVQDTSGLLSLKEFQSAPAAIHNFQGNPQEIWAFAAYATGPSCRKGEEVIGKPLELVHWYLHEVPVTKESGEKVKAVRTVLVTQKGDFYGFVSDGVYNSLRQLIAAVGLGPYNPPQRIVVTRGQGKGSRRFYAIEPAPIEGPKKKV